MPSRDYVPKPDAEFDQFVANYNTQLIAQGASLGMAGFRHGGKDARPLWHRSRQ